MFVLNKTSRMLVLYRIFLWCLQAQMDVCLLNSLSDDAVSLMMNQLINLGEFMAASLVPEVTPLEVTIQASPLLLQSLTVYLQWSLHVFKNHILETESIDDCNALFNETASFIQLPETEEYKGLADRFKKTIWKPLQPLMNVVL